MARVRVVIAWCFLLLLPAAALAQGGYFGRNKVQYREFDFQVLKTEHFDIYFYPEEEEGGANDRPDGRALVRAAVQAAEPPAARPPAADSLRQRPRTSGRPTAIQGEIGEGTGGVTEAYKRRIVLPLAGPLQATDHVLGHELVHAFQYDITNTNVSSGTAGALRCRCGSSRAWPSTSRLAPSTRIPRCGCAESTRTREAPDDQAISTIPRYFPYRYGHAFWAYIGGRFGDEVLGDMLRAAVAAPRRLRDGDRRRALGEDRRAVEGVAGRDLRRLPADRRSHEDASRHRPRRDQEKAASGSSMSAPS